MTTLHRRVLRVALLILALSLIIPGLQEVVSTTDRSIPSSNQHRALYSMVVALGLISIWACILVEKARTLVLALGIVMGCLVTARVISLWLDGWPDLADGIYLLVEAVLAALFLLWPPPR